MSGAGSGRRASRRPGAAAVLEATSDPARDTGDEAIWDEPIELAPVPPPSRTLIGELHRLGQVRGKTLSRGPLASRDAQDDTGSLPTLPLVRPLRGGPLTLVTTGTPPRVVTSAPPGVEAEPDASPLVEAPLPVPDVVPVVVTVAPPAVAATFESYLPAPVLPVLTPAPAVLWRMESIEATLPFTLAALRPEVPCWATAADHEQASAVLAAPALAAPSYCVRLSLESCGQAVSLRSQPPVIAPPAVPADAAALVPAAPVGAAPVDAPAVVDAAPVVVAQPVAPVVTVHLVAPPARPRRRRVRLEGTLPPAPVATGPAPAPASELAASYTSLVFWLKAGVMAMTAVGILLAGVTSREATPAPPATSAAVAAVAPIAPAPVAVRAIGAADTDASERTAVAPVAHGAPVASAAPAAPAASATVPASDEAAGGTREQGALDITAMRSDALLIDRVEAGKGPHLLVVLPAGKHEVRARRADGEVPVTVEVVAGRRAKLDLRTHRRSRRRGAEPLP